MTPHIDIGYASFLDPVFKRVVLLDYPNIEVPSVETVKERVKNYRLYWEKNGELILRGITEALDMNFMRSYIPVYVVSLNPRDFSNPFVIKSRYTESEFIQTMSHELIHCLCTDNAKTYKEPFPNNKHIIVHAALAYLFLDVFKKEALLKENIEHSSHPLFVHTNGEYIEAWNYVEKHGYKKILDDFKNQKSAG